MTCYGQRVNVLAAGHTHVQSHTQTHTHQISCVSSSSELSDRNRFRYYFQVLASEARLAYGFFELIKLFQWRQVGIIAQNENLFTVVRIVTVEKIMALEKC